MNNAPAILGSRWNNSTQTGRRTRPKKKIEQIVKPNKDEITKNRIPGANQYKAYFLLMIQPNLIEYLFQKGLPAFN